MPRKTQLNAAIAVATLVVLLMAGCASSEDRVDEPLPVPSINSVTHFTAHTPLPFDAYHLSDAELSRLQLQASQYIQRCAERFGVQAILAGDYLRPDDDSRLYWGGPLGTITMDHASSWGYHSAPGQTFSLGPGFYIKDARNLQLAQTDPGGKIAAVLYGGSENTEDDETSRATGNQGIPEGGCFGELEQEVGDPLLSLASYTSDLMNLTYNDSRVQDAMTSWSTCMKTAGYDLDHVQDPSSGISVLNEKEVATAVTDVECTRSSGWSDMYYTVLSAYQDEAIKRHLPNLQAVLKSEEKWLTALDRLLNQVPAG